MSLIIGIVVVAAVAATVLVLRAKYYKEDEQVEPVITEQEVHAELTGNVEPTPVDPIVEEPTPIIDPARLPIRAVEKKAPTKKAPAKKKPAAKKKKADA